MSERLTDEELDMLAAPSSVAFGDLERLVPMAAEEIRSHRARALAAEEREALAYAQRFLGRMLEIGVLERETRALGALSILTRLVEGDGE